MKLESRIYKSKPATRPNKPPRFRDQELIQKILGSICRKWVRYFEQYIQTTSELFGGKKRLPWEETERSIVSTLSAAISRYFRDSLVMEEVPVQRLARNRDESLEKGRGRCDLFASIRIGSNESARFTFYLEAKANPRISDLGRFQGSLQGRYGISKLFRDYQKTSKRVEQRTPYGKLGPNDHLVVGLLVCRLDSPRSELKEIVEVLSDVYESKRELDLRSGGSKSEKRKDRLMQRYPTVALVVRDVERRRPAMVASFTVLASTKKWSNLRPTQEMR